MNFLKLDNGKKVYNSMLVSFVISCVFKFIIFLPWRIRFSCEFFKEIFLIQSLNGDAKLFICYKLFDVDNLFKCKCIELEAL